MCAGHSWVWPTLTPAPRCDTQLAGSESILWYVQQCSSGAVCTVMSIHTSFMRTAAHKYRESLSDSTEHHMCEVTDWPCIEQHHELPSLQGCKADP